MHLNQAIVHNLYYNFFPRLYFSIRKSAVLTSPPCRLTAMDLEMNAFRQSYSEYQSQMYRGKTQTHMLICVYLSHRPVPTARLASQQHSFLNLGLGVHP